MPMIPHTDHTTKLIPTLSVCVRTPLGEIKIPDPIIVPTIMAVPLRSPSCIGEDTKMHSYVNKAFQFQNKE